jgi:hypothetical protein
MKVKNHESYVGHTIPISFTGIVEWCDGAFYAYDAEKIVFIKDGDVHNENGPAIVRFNGAKFYWLNNQPYSENVWIATVMESRKGNG